MKRVSLSSLRVRLLFLVLLALLPALGLTVYTGVEHRRLAARDASKDALRIAQLAAVDQRALIERGRQLLLSLTHLSVVQNLDVPACNTFLAGILKRNPDFLALGTATPSGDIECSAPPLARPINLADRGYFRRAVETRGFAISGYLIGRNSGKPNITLAYPMIDASDRVRAVLFLGLALSHLNQLAAEAHLPPGSTLTVLDETGVVLVRYPEDVSWVGKAVADAPLARAIWQHGGHDESTIRSVGLDGVSRYYAVVPLATAPGPRGAVVAVGIPTAVIFAEADRIFMWTLWTVGLAALLVSGLGWVLSNMTILRPIRDLVGAAGRFAAGELSTRSGLSDRGGELGQLARAFNDMAVAIQQRTNDRERAEVALRESETRFREAFNSAAVGMTLVGLDGRWLLVNQALCEMVGYSDTEFRGMSFQDITHPDDLEADLAQVRRLLAGEIANFHMEKRYIHKRGHRIWILLSVGLVRDTRGNPLYFVTQVQDTTRRKEAEQFRALDVTLAQTMMSARPLTEVTPALLQAIGRSADWDLVELWVVDTETNVLRCHSTWHRSALEVDGLIGERRASTYLPSVGLADRVWASGQPEWNGDSTALGRHEALAVPVMGTATLGVLVCLSWAPRLHDEAMVELTKNAANRIGQHMEHQQSVATLQESEAQVRQLQRLDAVGRLAGGVAHDFNNLLTVILGRTYLLRAKVNDQRHPDLEVIQQAAERAAALTKQLLAFSRKQILEPQVLDLNDVIAGMLKMLTRLIGEDIELIFRPGSALGSVHADPGQVEQVVTNLVVNAGDAMPEGGQLTVESAHIELDRANAGQHPEIPPGAYVMLTVSDTGIGMGAKTQAMIFDPFFTTKAPGKGTGLGLSTVYGIIKQSGGHIGVYSELGRGTTFKVYLPRVIEAPAIGEPALPEPGGGTETILVVEDEDAVRALVLDALEGFGYTVLTASRPAEAIELADQHPGPIHLMATDVIMPQMNGRQLADAICPRRPAMKVLYMSGYTDHAIVHGGTLESGMVFIRKPFAPDVLARKVREVLDAPPHRVQE